MTNVKRFEMEMCSQYVEDGCEMLESKCGDYVLFSDYSLLLERLERMQKALKKYGRHESKCFSRAFTPEYARFAKTECTCGFSEIEVA